MVINDKNITHYHCMLTKVMNDIDTYMYLYSASLYAVMKLFSNKDDGGSVTHTHTPIIHLYHHHHHCRDESLREMLLSWGLPAQLGLLR